MQQWVQKVSNDRNRRIINTFMASLFAKGIAIGCMYFSVSLASDTLGKEQFGLWMLITAIVGAMQFADMGVGNCLLNMAAIANAREDQDYARRAVTTSIVLLTLLCLLILLIFGVTYSFVDWQIVFKLSSGELKQQVELSVFIMVVCLSLNLPLLAAQRVQMGYQDGSITNLWLSSGSIFSLLGVYACNRMEEGLPAFVMTALGGPVVAAAFCWVYEFFIARPWLFPSYNYFDISIGKYVLKEGAIWTVFQLMAFLGTALDGLIIAFYFGAEAVTSYSLISKILTGLLFAQLLAAPLWPAFAEAIERGDVGWAYYTFRRSLIMCVGIGFAGGVVIFFMSSQIIKWWLGSDFDADQVLIAGFAVWSIVINVFSGISALMASHKLLPKLTKLCAIAALLSLSIKLFLAKYLGPNFVIWGAVVGYGLISVPSVYAIHRYLTDVEIHRV